MMSFQKPFDPFISLGLLYPRNVIVAQLGIVKFLKMLMACFFYDKPQIHSFYCSCVPYRPANKSVWRFHPSGGFFPYTFEYAKRIKFICIMSFYAKDTQ